MVEQSFSVLIPTYEGDKPKGLKRALNSVLYQTIIPDEIVIVADGQLTSELESILEEVASSYPNRFTRIDLPNNQGLGTALKRGVETCTHDLIARLDADDVAINTRFEKQLKYMSENPDVDVLGGFVGEFPEIPTHVETIRRVPITPEEVRLKARVRNPINHPTVMFRREAVLNAGNYRPLRLLQDYDLWMRMLSQGYIIDNIPEVLVKCEAGEGLYRRRGGIDYAKLEANLQYGFWRTGLISFPFFLLNVSVRIPIRLVPNRLRGFVYQRLLRY